MKFIMNNKMRMNERKVNKNRIMNQQIALIERLKSHFNQCFMNVNESNAVNCNEMESMSVDNNPTIIYINGKQFERIMRNENLKMI